LILWINFLFKAITTRPETRLRQGFVGQANLKYMNNFKLHSKFNPAGDQPKAIEGLLKSLKNKNRFQTLLGVTGSGKTFTMANVIAEIGKPTLVIAHNKTLAAQLNAGI